MTGGPIREAVKGAAASIAREGGEQAALFDLPVASDPSGEIAAAQARGFKGGRPKGAQNLSTRQLREFLLAKWGGRTPQERLAQWASLGPEGLARALHIDLVDAFDRWVSLERYLGEFFAAKMVPVDADGKPAPAIVVSIGGQTGHVMSSGEVAAPWMYVEQDQRVIEGDAAQSKEPEPET